MDNETAQQSLEGIQLISALPRTQQVKRDWKAGEAGLRGQAVRAVVLGVPEEESRGESRSWRGCTLVSCEMRWTLN